jgi:tRNA threonylcarbamoyladenosine biosynthesis protein TsaB
MKHVLGIDASTTACSAAVLSGGDIAAWRLETMERGQAERLNPMIGEVMIEAGVRFADLSLVAVTTGPGAFTGLRIGLACARAIALAAAVPLAGITTFDALARAVPDDERGAMAAAGGRLLVCVEAKRRDVFVQFFDTDLVPLGDAGAMDGEAARAALGDGYYLVAGDGAERLRPMLSANSNVRFSKAVAPPDARHVAAIGAARGPSTQAPRPFYIRPPDVRLPAKG